MALQDEADDSGLYLANPDLSSSWSTATSSTNDLTMSRAEMKHMSEYA
jgi:hypothetical protein